MTTRGARPADALACSGAIEAPWSLRQVMDLFCTRATCSHGLCRRVGRCAARAQAPQPPCYSEHREFIRCLFFLTIRAAAIRAGEDPHDPPPDSPAGQALAKATAMLPREFIPPEGAVLAMWASLAEGHPVPWHGEELALAILEQRIAAAEARA